MSEGYAIGGYVPNANSTTWEVCIRRHDGSLGNVTKDFEPLTFTSYEKALEARTKLLRSLRRPMVWHPRPTTVVIIRRAAEVVAEVFV